jgi:glutathione S-transferase
MTIVLYELQPTRSERVRWTLLEIGTPFESITGREVFAMPELAQIWHTARNLFIYSEEERVPAVYTQDAREAKRGLAVLDGALKDKTWRRQSCDRRQRSTFAALVFPSGSANRTTTTDLPSLTAGIAE